ncbi:MAG TPA: pyridoxamine 5'-phosphate oxidase [Actinomycetota bacterium]
MSDPRQMRAPSGFHDDRPLERDDLLDDPLAQFRRWLADAEAAEVPLPNAMGVATADADGRPSVRHVLLRGVDARGFQFFTNRRSRKGRQLAENPWAGAVFLWKELDRQVNVTGPVEPLPDAESDAYFAERPRDAQLGAWVSAQSSVIDGRAVLETAMAAADDRFPADVPRPPHWGGYVIHPHTIEFWQGRRHRLHDRFLFTAESVGWRVERLAP